MFFTVQPPIVTAASVLSKYAKGNIRVKMNQARQENKSVGLGMIHHSPVRNKKMASCGANRMVAVLMLEE